MSLDCGGDDQAVTGDAEGGAPRTPLDPGALNPGASPGGVGTGAGANPAPRRHDSPYTKVVKVRVEEDPDAVLQFSELGCPSLDELRGALQWAFEGQDVTGELLDRYAAHARAVLEGNRVMNLTAIVEAKEIATKHYLDSWRATRFLPLFGRSLLDLGTGAGFPGVPIAMAEPQARVCMIDSTKKRAEFVEGCLRALAVSNATAVWGRAEEHLARNKYDMVVMRAISSVRENVRLLRKVRHSHKDLVMLKGPAWSREARAAEREAERLGFKFDTVFEYELPGEKGSRAILVYRAPGGHGN